MKRLSLAVFSTSFALVISIIFTATSVNARGENDNLNRVHPIVDAQTGYLLGSASRGKWIDAKNTARQLKGGEEYSLYGNSTRAGDTTGSKTRTDEAPCEETQWVRLKKNFNGIIGLGANWNAIPRKPRPQSLNQKNYINQVAKILKANKIKKPKVVLTQLWRVDLDGDKTEEVLISATNYAGEKAAPKNVSSNANAGEYSLVLLRKIVKGKVKTITLASEIYSQNKEFSAPSVHRIAGVYDLNGDGKMEILLNSRYYEGDWMSVIEVKGAEAKEVLSAGCGA